MKLALHEIADLLGAAARVEAEATSYGLDSRRASPGQLFFAVRGERFDGHDYVEAALAAGAVAAVVGWPRDRYDVRWRSRLLEVPDTLAALQRLARHVRRLWGGPVVAVTGSAGKTTTKDMIAAVLGTRMRVLKTEGNLNNHFGLPLTLLRLEPRFEVAVLELGMNHAGEIAALAAVCEPNIAVFTNVGAAHLANFASLDAIGAAKRELAEAIPAAGMLVLNADDPRVAGFGAGLPARQMMYGAGPGCEVALDEVPTLRYPGRQHRYNAAAAWAVGRIFNVSPVAAREALADLEPGAGRGRTLQAGGATLLDDCYNANPAAMEAMLAVLAGHAGARRIAVLGEMRELGRQAEALHGALGRAAAAQARAGRLDALFAVQGEARHTLEAAREAGFAGEGQFFSDAAAAGRFLAGYLRAGDVALFKASRAVKLEEALAAALQSLREGARP